MESVYQLAALHDADPVCKLADEIQVMGDEQTRGAGLLLQIHQEIDDRGLNRHIQRGGDFIADHKFRLGGEGPGDRYALFFAARQLMRKSIGVFGRQTDFLQKLRNTFQTLFRWYDVVEFQGPREYLPHPLSWVERSIGVLEDDLHRTAVDAVDLGETRIALIAEVHGAVEFLQA